MEIIRAFIAIQLPGTVRDALGALSAELAAQVPHGSVRWVKPEAMHLTLRFLGDIAVNQLPALQMALDVTTAGQPPLQLTTHGFGCFPNCRRPRVLWAGLSGDVAGVRALKERLDGHLAPLGWPAEERAFNLHLTLGRVKDGRLLGDQQWPPDLAALAVPVTTIHLIQSDLRPDGPRYTVRYSSALQGG